MRRSQRNALASCYWRPCNTCGLKVPVIRGVGTPCAGFGEYHGPTCSYRSRSKKVTSIEVGMIGTDEQVHQGEGV